MILASVKNNYNMYIGTSSDDKDIVDIPKYSIFFELDTGSKYYFDGTDWQAAGGDTPTPSGDKSSDKVGTGQVGYMKLNS